MYLTPAGQVLVCENGNDRLQELSGLGEAEPEHIRFIAVDDPLSIALHGDMIAVGIDGRTVQLLNYASGVLIRSIGCEGSGPGGIGSHSFGLRFSHDGLFIVVAEGGNPRLSMFRVADGSFVKHIGVDVVAESPKDVELAPNGDLLVADMSNHRVCVFSADDDTLLRSWDSGSDVNCKFKLPTAFALAGNQLFVLEFRSARVEVFV
jgi:hypothetical protein